MSYPNRKKLHPGKKSEIKSHNKQMVITTAIILSVFSLILAVIAVESILVENGRSKGQTSAQIPPKLAEGQIPGTRTNSVPKTKGNITAGLTVEKHTTRRTSEKQPSHEVSESKQSVAPSKSAASHLKVVYLTFDDGPSKYTESILSILHKHGIHATFFMIGSKLAERQQNVKDAAKAGNYIGLHSMSHNRENLYESGDPSNFIKEFNQEQKLMKQILNTKPRLIRAPYGSVPDVTAKIKDEIAAAGFKMWDWTIDSMDWEYPDKPERIMQEIKRQIHRNKEVILMHEKAQTVKILPQVIEYLQQKGYVFAVYKPDQHFSVNFSNDQRL